MLSRLRIVHSSVSTRTLSCIPVCQYTLVWHMHARTLFIHVFSHVLGPCATGKPIRKGLPNDYHAYLIRLTLNDNIKHSTMIPAALVQLKSKHNWSHLNEFFPLNGHSNPTLKH